MGRAHLVLGADPYNLRDAKEAHYAPGEPHIVHKLFFDGDCGWVDVELPSLEVATLGWGAGLIQTEKIKRVGWERLVFALDERACQSLRRDGSFSTHAYIVFGRLDGSLGKRADAWLTFRTPDIDNASRLRKGR